MDKKTKISIEISVHDQFKELEENEDIGNSDDLREDFDDKKLGFNLPTNDLSKSGDLDNISVDSYCIGNDELEDIKIEKQINPINPDYKTVYEKIQKNFIANLSNNNQKENK